MMQFKLLKAIKKYMTGDVVFSFANSFVGLIKGPIVMLLIPIYLSENTQGYWYTFGSLSALSIFADLGFGAIVGQFAAHEFAHLRFDKDKTFIGERENLERMSSLYKFVLKWALAVCLIAFPIILIVGYIVLSTHEAGVNWQLPWLIMIITSGFGFVSRVSLTFLEGCGQIKNIQINNLVGVVVLSAMTMTMLALGCDLYSLVIPILANAIVSVTLMIAVFRKPLMQLLKIKCVNKFNWGKNFMRLMWKYAISWSSGYFIFQIYTPLAFMIYDPALAGKVGITMSLVQACFTIATTWSVVLVPKMNMAVANRDWVRAESYAKKGGLMSVVTYLFGAAVILLAIGVFQDKIKILSRFLGIVPISILLVVYLIQLPINNIATYGRAHKQEPFLWTSLMSALIIASSTVVLVYIAPIDFMFAGLLLSHIINIFILIYMYKKKRNSWHQKLIDLQDAERIKVVSLVGDIMTISDVADISDVVGSEHVPPTVSKQSDLADEQLMIDVTTVDDKNNKQE